MTSSNNKVYDEEEARDDTMEDEEEEMMDEPIAPLGQVPPTTTAGFNSPPRTPRTKTVSDMTGLNAGVATLLLANSPTRPRRGADRRSVSELVWTISESQREEKHATRRRQTSTSDLITKFGYAPTLGYDDLKLAEEIGKHGNRRERRDSGISDVTVHEEIDEDKAKLREFTLNEQGLSSEEAHDRLSKYGPNALPEKIDPKWLIFLRLLIQPMPIMIWIAIIIEAAITNFIDMAILLAIQFINASISFYETNKAGNAIAALKKSLKPTATVKRDGKFQEIDGTLVVPGDTVLLASGAAVPADCRVNFGEIDVDQAALTGESLPVTFYQYDSCKMGSNVVRGEVEATVEFTGADTFFGKTAALLEDKHEQSHLQKVLITVMLVLVGLSVTLCLINFIYLYVLLLLLMCFVQAIVIRID